MLTHEGQAMQGLWEAGGEIMDSAAFHALVGANAYAIEQDHRLVIRNLQPNCARVLGLCDWDQELAYEGAS